MAELTPVRLFVFGLGYSALAFARLIKDRTEVSGTTRDPARIATLAAEGIRAFSFDGKARSTWVAEELSTATHVLVSVPPGEADPVLKWHAEDLRRAPALRWLGYLSSAAVYGNYGGAWVSERTTPHPKTERAVGRRAAEVAWEKIGGERDLPVARFRLAGIYGPGRNAFVALAEGRAHRVVKPGQVFNRIHVDDIAAALAAAFANGEAGVFNLADDEPAPPEDVVAHAATLMGVLLPAAVPIEAADLSPMARSFYVDNKRLDNRRMKQALGVALRYPGYRDGLAAMWASGTWRG